MKQKRPVFPREDFAAIDLYSTPRDPVEVDLSDNTNLWGTHPGALEAIRGAVDENLTRYPDFYSDEVREAAAARFGVGPGNICTGAGSDHILDCAFRCVAASGGVVSYAAPTFVMAEYFGKLNGRTMQKVPWSQALAHPEKLLENDPALVYVCRPNNPTGLLAPAEWVTRLLDMAGPDGPLFLIDEAYGEFAPETFVQEAAKRSRLLVSRTLSKAYGLAGLRIGIGVASPEVAREMEKARGPYMVSSLSELAAVKALRDEEGWVDRNVAECMKCRDRLIEELRSRSLSTLPTATNFVMVQVPDGCALRYAKELRARGIAIRPFPCMDELGDGIRVTVGPWPLMERFLGALDEIIAEDARVQRVVVEVEPDARKTTV
jgi:histidinol-phosphate aminotransferase